MGMNTNSKETPNSSPLILEQESCSDKKANNARNNGARSLTPRPIIAIMMHRYSSRHWYKILSRCDYSFSLPVFHLSYKNRISKIIVKIFLETTAVRLYFITPQNYMNIIEEKRRWKVFE